MKTAMLKSAAFSMLLAALTAVAAGPGGAEGGQEEIPEWVRKLMGRRGERGGLWPISCDGMEAGVEVICGLEYRDMRGDAAEGRAKLYLPQSLKEDAHARLPLVHFAGYEADRGAGKGHISRGEILSTPHDAPVNPLVRGENLDIAILHRVRALPFVDDTRVGIFGGSAGGYMALLLAAETFPVDWCVALAPPVNIAYNLAYLSENRDIATAQSDDEQLPAMPVLAQVAELGPLAAEVYGSDFDSDAWLAASPIGRIDEITCPTAIILSTADILVPIQQFGEQLVVPVEASTMPREFTAEISALVTRETSRRTLLDVLPDGVLDIRHVDTPEEAVEFDWTNPAIAENPMAVEMPFSRYRQVSLVVLDEGPPTPQCAHTKHAVNVDPDAYRKYHSELPLSPDQVTVPKLKRLMVRYTGLQAHPALVQPPDAPVPFVANRMDFAELERADVIRGLLTFCADDQRAARLADIYGQLPEQLQVLGEDFATGTAEEMRGQLRELP